MAVMDAPVARVNAEARAMHRPLGVALLTMIAALFIAVGKTANWLWFAATWCAAAVKVGWAEAREARVSDSERRLS